MPRGFHDRPPQPPSAAWPAFAPALVLFWLLSVPAPAAEPEGTAPQLPPKLPPQLPRECAAPQPGRYLVLASGRMAGDPLARLLQETWTADGRISGVLMERRGRGYRRVVYGGTWTELLPCAVSVQRRLGPEGTPAGEIRSELVLGPRGRPRVGIDVTPGAAVSESWIPQTGRTCRATDLDGIVIGRSRGQSWRNGAWVDDAVIQREAWQGGRAVGLAVSSAGGSGAVAAYRGQATVAGDCSATLRRQDAAGGTGSYVAVIRSDGRGYAYLQTQPDRISLGLLQRVSRTPPATPPPRPPGQSPPPPTPTQETS